MPDVQQRKQHELLNRFSGIELIADDILVCGETEEEAESDHDANLLVLLECCWEVKLCLEATVHGSRSPVSWPHSLNC